jgi:hypothetical protein
MVNSATLSINHNVYFSVFDGKSRNQAPAPITLYNSIGTGISMTDHLLPGQITTSGMMLS